jgi:hypothetical protein
MQDVYEKGQSSTVDDFHAHGSEFPVYRWRGELDSGANGSYGDRSS